MLPLIILSIRFALFIKLLRIHQHKKCGIIEIEEVIPSISLIRIYRLRSAG